MNSSSSSSQWNEGMAIFITFAILLLLSVWSVTSKLALWVAIAITALVWDNAWRSGQLQNFWNALGK